MSVILIGIMIGISALVGDFLSSVDHSFQNLLYRNRSITHLAESGSVTIVTIDNKTLRDPSRGGMGRWQDFRRDSYATVINNLTRDGAVVIGINVLFDESGGREDDTVLADAMAKNKNIVIGFSKDSTGYDSIFPTEILRKNSPFLGFYNEIRDPVSGVVYGLKPTDEILGQRYEHFALATLRLYYETIYGSRSILPTLEPDDTDYPFYTSRNIQKSLPLSGLITSDGTMRPEILIDLMPERYFPEISFVDAFSGVYDPRLVSGRIVLIGPTAAVQDEYLTPIGPLPGVVIQANAIDTILHDRYLHYLPLLTEIVILVILVFILSIIGIYADRSITVFGSILIGTLTYTFLYIHAFSYFHLIFAHPSLFFLTTIFSLVLTSTYRYMAEDSSKRLLRRTMSQYLADDLVVRMLERSEDACLGGERRNLVCFFSDIAGFTSFSETREPEEIMRFLGIYLQEVSDVIMHHKGFINKYEGDAVMALWGVFHKMPNKDMLACTAALEQQKVIANLALKFSEEFEIDLIVRMGIHHGPAVVGNVGSIGKKLEFTALGDTINTASRLEGINKIYGTRICVSEIVRRSAGDTFVFRRLDSIRLKGRSGALVIYELVGYRDDVAEKELRKIFEYEQAMEFYLRKHFTKAVAMFDRIAMDGDRASEILAARCRHLIEHGITLEWDGVYTAEEK